LQLNPVWDVRESLLVLADQVEPIEIGSRRELRSTREFPQRAWLDTYGGYLLQLLAARARFRSVRVEYSANWAVPNSFAIFVGSYGDERPSVDNFFVHDWRGEIVS